MEKRQEKRALLWLFELDIVEVKRLYKWIAFYLAVVNVCIVCLYALESQGFYFHYTFLSETMIFALYATSFFVSMVTLVFIATSKKEKKWIQLEGITIDENVFANLAESVLNKQKEIKSYEVKAKRKRNKISINVELIPVVEKDPLLFLFYSAKLKKEIKEIIFKSTTWKKTEVTISYKGSIKKKTP